MDVKALLEAIHSQQAQDKRDKEEAKQREAAQKARAARAASEVQRAEATEELKEKLQTLPAGNKVGFRLDDTSLFRSIINVLGGLLGDKSKRSSGWSSYNSSPEVPIIFSAEGMSIRLMDQSHVGLLEATVPANTFYNYVYEGPKETKVGLRLSDLQAAAKIFLNAESLTWIIQGEKATIDLGNDHQLQLDLVETYSNDAIPTPKIELAAKVVMSKYKLAKILRECALAGEDQVKVTVAPRSLTFEGHGELGKSKVQVPFNPNDPAREEGISDIVCTEPQKATYSIEYMLPAVRGALADMVTFQLASKKPIRLEFPLADAREGASLVFWLAPRVSEPDDAIAQPKEQSGQPVEAPNGEPDEGPAPDPTTANQEQPSPTTPDPAPKKPKASTKRKKKSK